jgi:hypothetical protein
MKVILDATMVPVAPIVLTWTGTDTAMALVVWVGIAMTRT